MLAVLRTLLEEVGHISAADVHQVVVIRLAGGRNCYVSCVAAQFIGTRSVK